MELFSHQKMSLKRIGSLNFWIDNFLPWLVLAILLVYTYVIFNRMPYLGFEVDPQHGRVEYVYPGVNAGAGLEIGDQLIEVNRVIVADYLSYSNQPLITHVIQGQSIPIRVQRGTELVDITWVVPRLNPQELQYRLLNIWLLAYVFWICGLAVKSMVRPKDVQWRLLILFFFLTAVWIISGFVSSSKIWMSPIVFRAALWLSIPVLLHLHWSMPHPLGRIPAWGLTAGYLVFLGLSVAEMGMLLPRGSYLVGVAAACGGVVVLIGAHIYVQPQQRQALRIMGVGFLVAISPSLVASLTRMSGTFSTLENVGILALPALPAAYFYVISRKNLGSLELRSNRVMAVYLFLVLLGLAIFLLLPVIDGLYKMSISPLFPSLAIALLSGLLVVTTFPGFERWMNRYLFGIRLLPDRLVDEYSARLSTSLDVNSIVLLLRDELLPSLFVRQSQLFRLKGNQPASLIYAAGALSDETPVQADIDLLSAKAGRYISPFNVESLPSRLHWVRLVLIMQVRGERVGLWLLGQRDPDDFYSQTEISKLQSVANQTASALVNADQAAQLHALYQANIERHEEERIELASDLHDEVLNQLAVLMLNLDDSISPRIEESLQQVNDRLRRLIGSLRPAMLSYGLQAGLEELADEICDRLPPGAEICLEIMPSRVRYDARVESHLYRIIQQAAENAARHSGGKLIRISGDLQQEAVTIQVEDDGRGFAIPEPLNFSQFLEQRHFGLARMFERAAIIGADLQIHSSPGQGTKISLVWNANGSAHAGRV